MQIQYMTISNEEWDSVDEFLKHHRKESVYIREIGGNPILFNDMGFPVICDICGEYIYQDESWELLTGEDISILDHAGELPDHSSGLLHVDSAEHSCESRLSEIRREMEEMEEMKEEGGE